MSSKNCLELISHKLYNIEEIVNNFYKNLPKKNMDLSHLNCEQLENLVNDTLQNIENKNSSTTHSNNRDNNKKHAPNNVLRELGQDLSNNTLEDLINSTTQRYNNNNFNDNK
ncbi:14487_t:CDS:1 [Funneliformis geosporum]|uniref:14487_t:CDS:1 n=1 Tax=Funneliformis geosporum TaxID=1117311 RepID=A0A9W4WTU1_9GLOM|nr:14487_t:CDS:1 [Funneliformis geosporum]